MKTMDHVTDTELIKAFQEGDVHAVEVLINRYKDKVFSSLLFYVKDNYLAEDLFQDVFIKIIDTLQNKRYTEEGNREPCNFLLQILILTNRVLYLIKI